MAIAAKDKKVLFYITNDREKSAMKELSQYFSTFYYY